eukprot:m.178232 g.178232  ORF g.178232 m.178232 type:complete len:579 (+) comp16833_c0_seq1:36-1772(+)
MASYNDFGRSTSPVNVSMPDVAPGSSSRHQPPPRASMINFGSLSGFFDSNFSNAASYRSTTHELLVRQSSAYDEQDNDNADFDDPSYEQPLIQVRPNDSTSSLLNSSQPVARYGGDGDETTIDEPEPATFRKQLIVGLLYGIINSVILVPVLISFAQIIFRDPYYEKSMPYLIKLVILSSSVHQMVFSGVSTLPFAIGQVQDAGLIFLSSMASDIVAHGKAKDLGHDEILSTTLCWLAISTASLGLALYITGKLKLASLVQYLPLSVVAGYLAFIGLYCFEAGLSLMSGHEILGPLDWGKLFNGESMLLMCPGLLLGVALVFITGRFRHFAVLPCCLVAIPILFHITLLAAGVSLDEARSAYGTGWLAATTGETHFWQVWEHYQFGKVDWSVIPKLLPTWVAMYFVVAFSSSLDVAAIQMELGRALDFNHELSTVGISNLVSGLTGGFVRSCPWYYFVHSCSSCIVDWKLYLLANPVYNAGEYRIKNRGRYCCMFGAHHLHLTHQHLGFCPQVLLWLCADVHCHRLDPELARVLLHACPPLGVRHHLADLYCHFVHQLGGRHGDWSGPVHYWLHPSIR